LTSATGTPSRSAMSSTVSMSEEAFQWKYQLHLG